MSSEEPSKFRISLGVANMYYGSQYHLQCTPPYWVHRIVKLTLTEIECLEHRWCDACGFNLDASGIEES